MQSLLAEHIDTMRYLKEFNLHALMGDFFVQDYNYGVYLGIPSLQQAFYMPPQSQYYNLHVPLLSTLSTMYNDGLGHDPRHGVTVIGELKRKIGHILFMEGLELWKAFMDYADELLEEKPHTVSGNGVLFGYGIDGFRDRTQRTEEMLSFYPTLETQSKFHPAFIEDKLADEYQDFLDRYEKVIYVSFGITYAPSDELMDKII